MTNDLHAIAQAMVAPGKGILAADESTGTIKKRFDMINLESTEENRRDYRNMLFSADNVGDYISGVILFEETLFQNDPSGKPFVDILNAHGVLPGIKVDRGAKDMPGFPGEKFTVGLDDLRERLAKYRDQGAKFAKWRAVITIGDGLPTAYNLEVNARGLAHYAALCQEAGIVPIVEPEVLMDAGNTIEVCQEVTEATLTQVFLELAKHRIDLEGIVLKPNMVISGKQCATQASPQQVAEMTVQTLRRCVPSAVPGIAFLSGGQSEQLATEHLSLMNQMPDLPWALTFSYGRALQESGLKTWGGQAGNLANGQEAFMKRAKLNGAAAKGEYKSDMEAA